MDEQSTVTVVTGRPYVSVIGPVDRKPGEPRHKACRRRLRRRRQWVFIDTTPRHEEALRVVCAVSDFILIPARPGILDLRAIADTVGLVDSKPAVIVFNSCPPGRGFGESSVVAEARSALSVYGLPVCPVVVSSRVASSHALNGGLAVTEFEPEGKAAGEIRRLWEWLWQNVRS